MVALDTQPESETGSTWPDVALAFLELARIDTRMFLVVCVSIAVILGLLTICIRYLLPHSAAALEAYGRAKAQRNVEEEPELPFDE